MKKSGPLSALVRSAWLAWGVLVACGQIRADAPSGLPKAVDVFTDQYCSSCHDDEETKGGLDLTSLTYRPTDAVNFNEWVKVLDRVTKGEMPPRKQERPDPADQHAFVENLKTSLLKYEESSIAETGRATRRRLNRSVYEETLRDLLHAPWIHVKEQLPEDGEASRFNKVAAALDVSHVHMARYLISNGEAHRRSMGGHPETNPVIYETHFLFCSTQWLRRPARLHATAFAGRS